MNNLNEYLGVVTMTIIEQLALLVVVITGLSITLLLIATYGGKVIHWLDRLKNKL